ncbi:MAG: hypothetical protein P4L84_19285, partial [Isosphaeraceae bacterium]|nr:hypothetical protein [Isosphaeraceae bacterium]
MRLRVRVGKVLFWGTLLLLCTLAGALGFAYSYYTDSATLRSLIKAKVPRYLPAAELDLGTVRVRLFWGEVKVTHVAVRQVIDGANFQALRIPWLLVKHDARAMLKGHFEPREVILAQPTLRLCRRRDGTWNFQGLLADPWPVPRVKETPPVVIQNGTIELVDVAGPTQGTSIAILRDASIRLESGGGRVLKFEGTAKGEVFDHLNLSGTIDLDSGQIDVGGDLTRLVASDKLFGRLPPLVRDAVAKVGLSAGEVDLDVNRVTYDPRAASKLSYALSGRLRAGVWSCRKLPFTINDLTARFSLRNGDLIIADAYGTNGSTTVRGQGNVALRSSPEPPLDLHVDIGELELDERLRKWLPPE